MAKTKNNPAPDNDALERVRKSINITNISPTIDVRPDQTVVRMLNVEFTVKGFGPFSRQVPMTDADPTHLENLILEFATTILKLADIPG